MQAQEPPIKTLPPSLLVSATYDNQKLAAVLKFYNPETQKVILWTDETGHKPYCYSKLNPEELSFLAGRKDIIRIEQHKKMDLLNDKEIFVSKIIVTDPLAIGGTQTDKSIRNIIETWESDIKYYENYLYDRGLIVGKYYSIKDGKIVPHDFEITEDVSMAMKSLLLDVNTTKGIVNANEFQEYITRWAELLNQPIPKIRRLSFDIEVESEIGRIPDPKIAEKKVTAVGFEGSDGLKQVFVLRKEGSVDGKSEVPADVKVVFYSEAEEKKMIEDAFKIIAEYPFVITFNGDEFDMPYLYNRAERLGIKNSENPLYMMRDSATLKHGVHIDLYRTMSNRSFQIYAFSHKYTDFSLNSVCLALLNESKIDYGVELDRLTNHQLANYCYNDARLTYKLTSFNNDLLMNLLVVISRIARMPIDDIARMGVSQWIRSLLYYEHRQRNALIPRREELDAKSQGVVNEAIIKDKKYRGGLVIEPVAGIHFNVTVADFASLYPSIIKVRNLSYETVRCPHDECKKNAIPDTNHWVCTKYNGLTSMLIGSLRDLRVNYYKSLAKKAKTQEQKEQYTVVSQALKVILNASYGVMGAEIFPLYFLPAAEATTAIGRYIIMETIKKCKSVGIEVLYGDTDSLFIKNPTKEQIQKVIEDTKKEQGVDLEIDKEYRYVVLSGRKKNYLGVTIDGKVDVKGLTGKKSVDGKTPILVNVNNTIKFSTVEEVYHEFHDNNSDVKILTINDGLQAVWSPISDATKHLVKEVYEITTHNGRVLTLSGDHSVYTINEYGQLNCKETKNLNSGDVLIGLKAIPSIHAVKSINTSECIGDITAARNGYLISTIKHSTTGSSIKKKIPITPDVGFLLGIYTAEGVHHTRIAEISQNCRFNKEVCEQIEKSWMATFNTKMKKYAGKNSSVSYRMPFLISKLFSRICGEKSNNKKIPDLIFNADDEVKASYLRGLFSGDGFVDKKQVSITSKSKMLIEQTAYLLAYFNISSNIKILNRKKYGKFYTLRVKSVNDRILFHNTIGFIQPRFKINPVKTSYNKELLPISTIGLLKIKKSILNRIGITKFRNVNMHDLRYYNMSILERYNKIINQLDEHAKLPEKIALAYISRMLNANDVTYDKILKVEKKPGSRIMYDFSVPKYERFVAGNLPTLLHNSHTPPFIKNLFYELLDILSKVQTINDFEAAKKTISEKIATVAAKVKEKKIPVSELAFNVMISKAPSEYEKTVPQHIRAAKQLEQHREIKRGDIISYVKVLNKPGVKPTEMARQDEIDSAKYMEFMESTLDQITSSMDLDFDVIIGKPKQTGLDQFFWN
ncbi:MAG TPA: DNA-directed DNA polymerase I [Candidatus Nitrosotenuis sp.]|nr:DNA-directed DNA polymerase I [Candidatus Nitrosotenuis sp.]